ncbi:hypothetical protein JQ557_08190 [Bradyrhizobium sp. U87765 SZCCT0131]|uniref:hypothetical protein n=1 Tax=unclassified Bradyrhizobium TaxID=2631580 RepID=UPI001BAA2909|nr:MULTISPECIES: hypothetical protein [unclassified Bradyrhizobium]MBR1217964.1 hypothetical protein [Bradyrhizobium sp. U87765 SZCCT0131]MBR1261090.1 hypothetical protein [Bradyrhizobium sp. U87765 SZCCT0134]MBR1303462.1 hypothetical protein [Bradyrhizobium sp. U87765 SZCCT0110]MBR1319068.1 hypothetical protein [Bradyrhizobium sp. U87765 SZCCT0109]MBR1347393.1 hypothetical protein [Bradyrhizobium sp. U87765 SZCCT0048]
MHNAFDVFVDGSASIKHVIAQMAVGGVMLAATLLLLSRIMACLSIGAPPAMRTSETVVKAVASARAIVVECEAGRATARRHAAGACRS